MTLFDDFSTQNDKDSSVKPITSKTGRFSCSLILKDFKQNSRMSAKLTIPKYKKLQSISIK